MEIIITCERFPPDTEHPPPRIACNECQAVAVEKCAHMSHSSDPGRADITRGAPFDAIPRMRREGRML